MAKNLEENDTLPPDIDSVDDLENAEIEDTDTLSELDKKSKLRQQSREALKVRRAIEDKLEEVRLRKELDYLTSDDLDDDDQKDKTS